MRMASKSMKKILKLVGILCLLIALVLTGKSFLTHLDTLKGTFEYTYYEGIREHMYLYGLILLLGSEVTLLLGVLGSSQILKRIGYIGVAVQGTEVLIWEFADIYRGFYYGWEKINLIAFLLFPVACILLCIMVSRVRAWSMLCVLVSLICMFLLYLFGSYQTTVAGASLCIVVAGIILCPFLPEKSR